MSTNLEVASNVNGATRDSNLWDVIILGCGIAGLSVAYNLKQKNSQIKVLLLEGNDRIGGRLFTYFLPQTEKHPNPVPVDLGGQWIHGSEGNPIKEVADHFKLEYTQGGTGGRSIYNSEGKPCKKDGKFIFEDIMEEIDIIISKSKDKFNTSFQTAWDEASSNIQFQFNAECEESQYIQYRLSGHEQFEGTDISELALGHQDAYKDCDGGDIAIKGGYIKLLEKLAEGCNILLNHIVTEVDWKNDIIEIRCANNQIFQCKKCAVTIPVGVLTQGKVKFNPPLPRWKTQAFNQIGIGLMNKIVLRFPTCFWNKNEYCISYASKIKGEFRWFYNLVPEKQDNILVAFISANFAKQMEERPDEELVSKVMEILRKIFGKDIPDPDFTYVTHWGKNPFSYGSFSFMKVGCTPRDFTLSGLDVEEKLYFAGEHTSAKFCGCAHGAYDSGMDVASELIKFFPPS